MYNVYPKKVTFFGFKKSLVSFVNLTYSICHEPSHVSWDGKKGIHFEVVPKLKMFQLCKNAAHATPL